MSRFFLGLFLAVFSCNLYAQKTEVRLVSWNIQNMGKTKSSAELEQMAELLRDYDIVAIQEVVAGYGGAQAVARLTDILNRKGAQWDYVISNPTESPKYRTERYAIVWKNSHIKIKDRGQLIGALKEQLDREPQRLHFYMQGKRFTLLNFHSRPYNKDPESEIRALTTYIKDSLSGPVILAGDFNVNQAKPVFDGLRNLGYKAALTDQKTTLKRSCAGTAYRSYAIDNIFCSPEVEIEQARVIDFVRVCENLDKARKLSDHLPVSIVFSIK
jgi:endonuclease/exonuclease/phosphatase family metal-dependent hydrolase